MLQYCRRIQLQRAGKKYFNSAAEIEGIINFAKENKRVHATTMSLSFMKLITHSLYFSTKAFFRVFFFISTAATLVRIQFHFCLNIRELYNMEKTLSHCYSEPCIEEHRKFKGFIVIATKMIELKRRETQGPPWITWTQSPSVLGYWRSKQRGFIHLLWSQWCKQGRWQQELVLVHIKMSLFLQPSGEHWGKYIGAGFELSHVSCLSFYVLSSPPFPLQVFPTSSKQTITLNCEICQLQKIQSKQLLEKLHPNLCLTELALCAFYFSQGSTLEKAFSFSSSSPGIRWIAAFVFACYLNCDYYLVCFRGLRSLLMHTTTPPLSRCWGHSHLLSRSISA